MRYVICQDEIWCDWIMCVLMLVIIFVHSFVNLDWVFLFFNSKVLCIHSWVIQVSPIRMRIRELGSSFGHFLTNLCAIVGGTFTASVFTPSPISCNIWFWFRKFNFVFFRPIVLTNFCCDLTHMQLFRLWACWTRFFIPWVKAGVSWSFRSMTLDLW